MNSLYSRLYKERFILEQHYSKKYVEHLYDKSFTACMAPNGNTPKWEAALSTLSTCTPAKAKYLKPYLHLDTKGSTQALASLIPWRKGPFSFASTTLESEWNGSIKWQRLCDNLDITNKKVLDVGAGNGYFSFLLSLFGAQSVIALEPFMLFNYQFHSIKQLCTNVDTVHMFPLKLDDIALTQHTTKHFDIALSMGVLYHHKSPLEHLAQLKQMLRKEGTLIIETLYSTGDEGYSLTPHKRYANMRNVWFIPSIATLTLWLERLEASTIEVIDTSITHTDEQRKTSWLGNTPKSLEDFVNDDRTLEGYERPKRVLLKCTF